MQDFRGNELSRGDMVAWTVGRSEMRLGVIDSFTAKCARVLSLQKDGKPHTDCKGLPIYVVDTFRIAKL